ncbi:hypothetical protein FJZ18_01130 [Candidatus Pacearchaeota archaeon]|nr:hypothetical protein [Candidatus Pacearchaeota archaeon]
MAKNGRGSNRALTILLGVILWITGILVSLAVGFGMIEGVLYIPELETTTQVAGWIVVVLTIVGAVLAIIDKITE